MSAVETSPSHTVKPLSDQALEQLSSYFYALSEPNRLRIINLLQQGERIVGDIAAECDLTPTNVSRHLGVLAKHGMVAKRSQGTHVYYRIADPALYPLCEMVCGLVARRLGAQIAGLE